MTEQEDKTRDKKHWKRSDKDDDSNKVPPSLLP